MMKADNKTLEESKKQLNAQLEKLTGDLNELRKTIQDPKGEISDLRQKNEALKEKLVEV